MKTIKGGRISGGRDRLALALVALVLALAWTAGGPASATSGDVADPETCDAVVPIANGDTVTGRWDVCRRSYFTFDTDVSRARVAITLSAVDANGKEVAVDLILREGNLGASGTQVASSLRFGPLPSMVSNLDGEDAPGGDHFRTSLDARITRHDLKPELGTRGYASYSYEARLSPSHQPRGKPIVYPVTFTLTHESSHTSNSAQTVVGECPGQPQTLPASPPSDTDPDSSPPPQSDTDPDSSPPTANAGADFNIKRGETVTLRGSGTANDEGSQELSYRWTISGASDTELVTVGTDFLSNDTQAEASFTMMRRKHVTNRSTLDDDNYIEFTLTVTDGDGETHSDTVRATIQGTVWTQ